MALFPCDQHGGRYAGKQRTAYPALVNGNNAYRARRRLCPACFTELADWCVRHLEHVEGDTLGDLGCSLCSVDDAPYAIFVTLYPAGEERTDFYGRACRPCRAGAAGIALFGAELPLEAV